MSHDRGDPTRVRGRALAADGPVTATAPDAATERFWTDSAAAAVGRPVTASAPEARAGSLAGPAPIRATVSRPRGPQRARLQLSRVDPWSVLKATLVFATCLLVVFVAAVVVLYVVLSGMGVFSSVQSTLKTSLDLHAPLSATDIIGGAVVLALVNLVLLTALTTVLTFVYNITADLVGGLEVVLSDTD